MRIHWFGEQLRRLTARAIIAPCLCLALTASGQEPDAWAVPQKLPSASIENLFHLTPRVFSGGTPKDDAGFAQLQRLGVKTIISVDGARPDAEAARRHGIRYVHLPIGYDGVPATNGLRLVQAAQTLPGPVFVHCHHGQHRGPAAAAVICRAIDGWSAGRATGWLQQAGTSTNYPGLYRTVREFTPPAREALSRVPKDFPEHAKVEGTVESMVHIDESWDRLKAIRAAGFRTPSDKPDWSPQNEAAILRELLRELDRSPDTQQRGPEFLASLQATLRATDEFHAAMAQHISTPGGSSHERLESAFQSVARSCAACHKQHRD
ncbi:MAG: hypothetical protein AB1705_02305 [Verrucomicrobiota bacterium]